MAVGKCAGRRAGTWPMRLWPTRSGSRLGTPGTTIHDIYIAAIQQAGKNIYDFSSKFSHGSDAPGGVTIVLFVVYPILFRIPQPSATTEIFRIFFRIFISRRGYEMIV